MITVDEYENQIRRIDKHSEQKNVEDRVYSLDSYVNLMKEVLDMIVYETHFMSETELDYDRLLFKKLTSQVLEGTSNRRDDVRTVAELMTMMVKRKDGRIRYSGYKKPKGKK